MIYDFYITYLFEKGYTVDFEYFNSGHDYLC